MDPAFREVLMENGVAVAMLVWFATQNKQLVKRLFEVIENNTKAFAELKELVSKCNKKDG